MSNLQKLAEALRSGRYKKGQLRMYKDGCYCVMGVACDVYQKQVGDLKEDFDSCDYKTWDGHWSTPPEKVFKYFNLYNEEGTLLGLIGGNRQPVKFKDYYITGLMNLNDHTELTFEDMAEFIEQYEGELTNA